MKAGTDRACSACLCAEQGARGKGTKEKGWGKGGSECKEEVVDELTKKRMFIVGMHCWMAASNIRRWFPCPMQHAAQCSTLVDGSAVPHAPFSWFNILGRRKKQKEC